MTTLGIPWTCSTKLDATMTLPGQSVAGLQKTRKMLREQLASPETISLGRRGRLSLDTAALAPCLQTASRWGSEAALVLSKAYLEAGIERLVRSTIYRQALDIATDAVRRMAVESRSVSERGSYIPMALVHLVDEDPSVREVALAMHEIHSEVVHLRPEVRWYEGQMVRAEGDEALVVIDRGDREILKVYDASYLALQGIGEQDAFILQELQWTPDTVVSSFLPALDVESSEFCSPQGTGRERSLDELPEELITGILPARG